jgi:hypothetical protein
VSLGPGVVPGQFIIKMHKAFSKLSGTRGVPVEPRHAISPTDQGGMPVEEGGGGSLWRKGRPVEGGKEERTWPQVGDIDLPIIQFLSQFGHGHQLVVNDR